MKKHIMLLILLVMVLASCSNPDNDSSLTDFVDLENKENEVEQEKYIGHEKPILKPDSYKKEVNENINHTPPLTTPKETVDDITYGSIRYEDTSISF